MSSWQKRSVIGCFRPYSQQPMLAGELLLLAGAASDALVPVLEAIDTRSGESVWRCQWEDLTDEIEGGLPMMDPAGMIWQGLYARDSQFALQAVNVQGQRQGLWTLDDADSDYPIYGSDLSSKLIVAPAFSSENLVTSGWIYRHREAVSYVWNTVENRLLQRIEGWPHALSPGALLVLSLEHKAWECRDPVTAELHWSLPKMDWDYLGPTPTGWLFSEVGAVRLEYHLDRLDLEALYKSGHISQQDYYAELNQLVSPPGLIELRDPSSGRCLQRWELPGECLDARWAGDSLIAVCRGVQGTFLYRGDTDDDLRLPELSEPDLPLWLPLQPGQDKFYVRASGLLMSIVGDQIQSLTLPGAHERAHIIHARYRSQSMLVAEQVWLRDSEKLWVLTEPEN